MVTVKQTGLKEKRSASMIPSPKMAEAEEIADAG